MSFSIYSASQSHALDNAAQREIPISGYDLMRRAGKAAFDLLAQRWPRAKSVLVLCGGGNNGGDGWVLATLAKRAGYRVVVISAVDPHSLKGEASQAYADACREGVMLIPVADIEQQTPDVIVDALLGTGFKGQLRDTMIPLIHWINQTKVDVLSLDIPSGVAADANEHFAVAVHATVTLAFIAWKPAHWTGPARPLCGERILVELGVPASVYKACKAQAQLLSIDSLPSLPARSVAAHKGHFGHVVAIGGEHGMGGAVILTAKAALRSGAGLVSVVTRPAHVAALLAQTPEVMAHGIDVPALATELLTERHTLLIGPGLGQGAWGQALLQRVLHSSLATVVDADALNLISQWGVEKLRDLPTCIISPHPGEAARLLGCAVADIESDRLGAARRLQQLSGAVVVLKGAGTIVDDGAQVSICCHGNPGMASGGMGDVLSGVMAALLAQGLSAGDAARRAVAVHSAAADQLASSRGERGLMASDLMPVMRILLNE